MLNAPPIRFGLVGTGAIARSHAAALGAVPNASLIGVADVNSDAAKAFGDEHGCASFGSLRDLLAAVPVDALIVCTPPDTHCDLVLEAVAAGVHVLCEKPLALDLEQARTMLEAAAEAGVVLTMATKFRYVSDVLKAQNMIRLGVLGEILHVSNQFKSPVDMSARWNADPRRSGGGVLIDNGTHSVDIVRYLLGPIESIAAEEGPRPHGLAVDENVHLSLVCAGGVPASIDLSWTEQSQSPYYIEINGTRGRIGIGWKESVYTLANDGVLRPFGPGYDKIAAFAGQLRNVVDVLCGSATVEVGHADALASVAAISSAYEALRTGRTVAVERAPLHARSGLAVVS
jgi:predicted dehydrogenase